jgi:phosphatidylinositol alpha-1,6-mannosyltransferase
MGGIESLVYNLAQGLSDAGNVVYVYADARAIANEDDFDSGQSFKIYRTKGFKPLRRRAKARTIREMAESNNGSTFVLADTWKSLEHLDTSHLSRTICLAHGSEFPSQPSRRKAKRIKLALDKADTVIANSTYTANRLRSFSTDTKIEIIHPGITPPVIDQSFNNKIMAELESRYPILITVARLEKRKGHAKVIDLLPSIIDDYPWLIYLVIGDGSCRKALEHQVSSLSLEQHVRFIGPQAEKEKNSYLANSHIFIMPGIMDADDVEGFGMAYIEAASFGVPGIANDVGGASDAVMHDKTGLVCTPGNDRELLQCLRRLIKDDVYRQTLGKKAKANAASYLWNTKIHEYEKILFYD